MADTRTIQRVEWQLIAGLTGALAALVTRKALGGAWRAVGRDPDDAEWGSWSQALAWGLAVGAGVGAARVIARRAAAVGFEHVTGEPPPVEATS